MSAEVDDLTGRFERNTRTAAGCAYRIGLANSLRTSIPQLLQGLGLTRFDPRFDALIQPAEEWGEETAH